MGTSLSRHILAGLRYVRRGGGPDKVCYSVSWDTNLRGEDAALAERAQKKLDAITEHVLNGVGPPPTDKEMQETNDLLAQSQALMDTKGEHMRLLTIVEQELRGQNQKVMESPKSMRSDGIKIWAKINHDKLKIPYPLADSAGRKRRSSKNSLNSTTFPC